MVSGTCQRLTSIWNPRAGLPLRQRLAAAAASHRRRGLNFGARAPIYENSSISPPDSRFPTPSPPDGCREGRVLGTEPSAGRARHGMPH